MNPSMTALMGSSIVALSNLSGGAAASQFANVAGFPPNSTRGNRSVRIGHAVAQKGGCFGESLRRRKGLRAVLELGLRGRPRRLSELLGRIQTRRAIRTRSIHRLSAD